MPGYPDSHLDASPGLGTTSLRKLLFVAIPLFLSATWLIYFWSITGVHTIHEKYPNGKTKAAGYARRSGIESYKKHGHWVTYHENGQKESEGYYDVGQQTGEWTYWDEGGKKVAAPVALPKKSQTESHNDP